MGEAIIMIIRSCIYVRVALLCSFAAPALLALSACSADPEANAPPVYVNSCALCHRDGIGGAPITGDKAEWERRTSKGMAKVYANAIDGFEGATGIMPAKGSRMDLSDEEIKELVDFMVQVSQ
jgi:cytochrome c5